MDINEYLKNFDLAQFDCEYVDLRIEKTVTTNIKFEEFTMIESSVAPSLGAFVRVYENSTWYFLATTNFDNLVKNISNLVG